MTLSDIRKEGLLKRRNTEEGFTIIELLIVVVVLGILSSIAILIFSNQSRSAIEATVKSDVANNKAQIVNDKASVSGFHIEPDLFEGRAVRTDENVAGYTVSPDRTEACTWSSYEFGEDDSFYYHFSSETGKMVEGECDSNAGWNTIVINPEGETEEEVEEENTPEPDPEPETETEPAPAPAPPPAEEEEEEETVPEIPEVEYPYGFDTNDGNVLLNINLTTNARNKICFSVDVSTESSTPIPWEILIDRSAVPFKGNQFGSEILYHGQVDIAQTAGTATITGSYSQWASKNDVVVAGSPITVNNICIYGLNVTNAGMIRDHQEVQVVAHPVSGTQWFANQTFELTGSSQWWGIWEFEADLSELEELRSTGSQPIIASDGQHITMERIEGSIYKITLQDVPNNMYRGLKFGETSTIVFQK